MAVNKIFKATLFSVFTLIASGSMCAAPADSLDQMDYKYLFARIRQTKNNAGLQKVYLKSFLKKAKAQ